MANSLAMDLFDELRPGRSTPPASRKSQLGQFMTPEPIARFMTGLFNQPLPNIVTLLDAGAGQGNLTYAFQQFWAETNVGSLAVDAYELDEEMLACLSKLACRLNQLDDVNIRLVSADFVEAAATMIKLGRGPRYSHAILNPPYKKINSASAHRALLRMAGLETVNLYSGFVGLAVELLKPGGELVAIIPRSFCNGPYYQLFRKYLLHRCSITHIHLFVARNKAFKQDGVLQENVIIHLKQGALQGLVTISTSGDDTFSDYEQRTHTFSDVVRPDDPDQFIRIPAEAKNTPITIPGAHFQLNELGVTVSTGPVVDFRMRHALYADPAPGTVPLLYPGHFRGADMNWPRAEFKKPNAIRHDSTTEKWLYPSGYYTVVRRFSSKEERRRIVANVVDPTLLNANMLGFENHLNVFHAKRQPLAELLARGLAMYLNSTTVDACFRQFNGHTQVNATDLRSIRYPPSDALKRLGAWAKTQACLSQEMIDKKVATLA